jgi:hypothetical protein
MATGTTSTEYGSCTEADLVDLDIAMEDLRSAEQDRDDARRAAGELMAALLAKGAQRKAIAARANVTDQTVTNMAFGRPKKTTTRHQGVVT